MHTVACPACGAALSGWRSVPASEPALADVRFPLQRCLECGTAVTVGAPFRELHEAGAYGHGEPRMHRVAGPVLDLFDRQRLSLIRQTAPPPARLLDAGAGRGRFVRAAGRAGYEATGIEPSLRGAQAAARIRAPVDRVDIESAQIERSSLDVVTLWHVLEHLDQPGSALTRIHEWLRPGAILLVGVPNLASIQARLGGARWYHLDVPRHRLHFTPAGLSALLASTRFEVLAVHHLLLEHNPFGMWQSLVNRFTTHPSYLYNLLKRNAPARSPDLPITAAGLLIAPLATLLEVLAALARRGGTVAVLARRAE